MATATYTDIAHVRTISGISSTLVNDADVTQTIEDIEQEVDSYLNTTFQPKQIIETQDGNGDDFAFVERLDMLCLRALTINTTSITPNYVDIYKDSGKLVLGSSAEAGEFDQTDNRLVHIKYLYGTMEESSTSTTTSNAETAGTGTTVEVADGSSISDSDWVAIYGMDGKYEVTQVSSGGGTNNLVMDLYLSHAAGSTVVVLQIPKIIKRLTGVLAAKALVARVVGASFDEIVGYNLSGVAQVQKGEPYTQWRQTAIELEKEEKRILQTVKRKWYIGSTG